MSSAVLDNKDQPTKYPIEISQDVKIQEKQPAQPTTSIGVSTPIKIVIGTIIVFFVITLAIGLGVGLSQKASANQNNISPSPSPTFSCDMSPSECSGVPAQISNYILTAYPDAQQARSVLQLSRTLTSIPANTSRSNLTAAYQQLASSAQCMSYTMPSGYTQAYQDLITRQLNNSADIQAYLSMNVANSGQPVQLIPQADLASACQFNTTARRRRLQTSPNCTQQTSVLIYFSGIGSSAIKTITDLNYIVQTLRNSTNTTFDVTLSLGPSIIDGQIGFFLDTLISYQQMLTNSNATVFSQLDILRCFQLMFDDAGSGSRIPASMNMQDYQYLVYFFMLSSYRSLLNQLANYSINQHVNFVVNHLNEGKKVVLLAHGQGSQYANTVYSRLTTDQKRSISLVYVAPVVNSIADGRSSYLTNPNDYNINKLREQAASQSIQAPLAANAANMTFDLMHNEDGSNHDLLGYISSYSAQFVGLVATAKSSIVQPARTLGSGPITVSLTWDAQPDVDLHIFEPSYHIYYSRRTGNNGYLDRDDTDGYGPEHYYTGCNLELGNYTFKVNYYNGYAPSNVVMSVSAGSQYYTKQFVVNPAIGSSGDANPPYNICTVTVSLSPFSGNYLFSISHPD